MKTKVLFPVLCVITLVITAMSWNYFGSDQAGILRGKPIETRYWLPFFLRVHIAGGMLAMMFGAGLVFSSSGRMRLHRALSNGYALSILFSGLAGLIVAPQSIGGWWAGSGFTALALAWLYFTARAVQTALRADWPAHRRMVVYSLALTFSSLGFRLVLLIPILTDLPFITVYRLDSWLCWPLHLLVAAWWLRREQEARVPAVA